MIISNDTSIGNSIHINYNKSLNISKFIKYKLSELSEKFVYPQEIWKKNNRSLKVKLKYLSYPIKIWKKNNHIFLELNISIKSLNWKENLPIAVFYQNFIKYIKNDDVIKYYIYPDQELGRIEFHLTLELKEKPIDEEINYLLNDYSIKYNNVLKLNAIDKTITFSYEHLRAGSSILQYFGKILQEKYPNEKVSVSIKQEGLRVTMSIETPEGKKEEIEEYLNRYGMVVTNQITPEEFTSNPIQVLELKQELREAENKIQSQKELLALKDSTYNQTLVSLQDEVKFLREELSSLRRNNDESIKIFLSSLISKDKTIKKLSKAIDKENNKETKELLLELKDKKPEEYKSLKEQVNTLIISSVANAPSWVPFLGTIFK